MMHGQKNIKFLLYVGFFYILWTVPRDTHTWENLHIFNILDCNNT
jgi:hypothetical protein